ncbi:unnamed protein product [Merluccius merluccius]
MADVMNVGVNLEAFSQAINAIQALRSSVTRVFDSLKDGMKNKETLEGREKAFITEFQDNLQSVNRDLKSTWFRNNLKVVINIPPTLKSSSPHPVPSINTLLNITKNSESLCVRLVQVSLGKVLKAIVVMRSLFIDRTIVRGFNENIYSEDGKLDIWSKSQYQVFQKVTDHATTALLHYQLPQMPDVVVRSFMTWLRSYIKLFQSPCQRCGRFLQDGLPPTWRDFRTLEAFHDTCRM